MHNRYNKSGNKGVKKMKFKHSRTNRAYGTEFSRDGVLYVVIEVLPSGNYYADSGSQVVLFIVSKDCTP